MEISWVFFKSLFKIQQLNFKNLKLQTKNQKFGYKKI